MVRNCGFLKSTMIPLQSLHTKYSILNINISVKYKSIPHFIIHFKFCIFVYLWLILSQCNNFVIHNVMTCIISIFNTLIPVAMCFIYSF